MRNVALVLVLVLLLPVCLGHSEGNGGIDDIDLSQFSAGELRTLALFAASAALSQNIDYYEEVLERFVQNMQELGHALEITREKSLTNEDDVTTARYAYMADPALPDCEISLSANSSLWYSCTLDDSVDREYAADMAYALFDAIVQAEGAEAAQQSMDGIASLLGDFFDAEVYSGPIISNSIAGYQLRVIFSNNSIKICVS